MQAKKLVLELNAMFQRYLMRLMKVWTTMDENHSLAHVAMRPRVLRRVTMVLQAMKKVGFDRNG